MTKYTIEKFADVAVSDLTSGGGKLRDDKSETFIRKVMDRPGLISDVRSVSMRSDTLVLPKIGLGSRIVRAAPTGTAPYLADDATSSRTLAAASRFNPAFEAVTLSAKEYIAEILVTDDMIENNLEQEDLVGTIMALAAQRLSLDLEDLLINSDTSNAGLAAELKLQNGLIKNVTSAVVAHGAAISPAMFTNAQLALATKYLSDLGSYKFYMHNYQEIKWRAALQARATALGDATITGDSPVPALGTNIKTSAQLPTGTALLMNPKNAIVGFQRDIRLETERHPRQRMTSFIFTFKAAFGVEQEDAIVKITGIS